MANRNVMALGRSELVLFDRFYTQFVIPTKEESPLEARQRLGILITELLQEIPVGMTNFKDV